MAGGGTGGHILPAVNIAQAIEEIDKDAIFLFIGTKKGLEKDVIPRRGYDIRMISAGPWSGLKSVKPLRESVLEVKSIIKEFKPDCVIGTGGYVSAPVVLAAKLTKIKVFIQEQNSSPGLASKLSSLFAEKIYLGFEECKGKLWRSGNTLFTGNPIFSSKTTVDTKSSRIGLGLDPSIKTVFVTGGSQGSQAINDNLIAMIDMLGLPKNTQMLWQCGRNNYEPLKKYLDNKNYPIVIADFIYDMFTAYNASDLVVCRAGALTLAELASEGLPAILIPYPYAKHDEQRTNAQVFARRDAAMIIEQSDLTPEILYASIDDLITNEKRLSEMSMGMKQLSKPDAAQIIAKSIFDNLSNFGKTIERKK